MAPRARQGDLRVDRSIDSVEPSKLDDARTRTTEHKGDHP